MFKIQQLFEENNIVFNCQSRNQKQVLDKHFGQLISQQETEQVYIDQIPQDYPRGGLSRTGLIEVASGGIDQEGAQFFLSKSVQLQKQGKPRRKPIQKVKQRKYEQRSMEAQIEQIEQVLLDRELAQQQTGEEVELLGKRINEIKDESCSCRDELQRFTLNVQDLSQAYSNLANQCNQIKNSYIQMQQEIKTNQMKQNQLQASSLHYEQEFDKLSKEQQRLNPKLMQKQQKLEELDSLKQKLELELQQMNQSLDDARAQLKSTEDELAKTNNFEKMIKNELKAQQSLQMERKLLLDEFQRICTISGIDQLAQQNDEGLLQEMDLKIKENQQTIDSQEEQMNQLQQEINQMLQKEESMVNRRNELITRYQGLERQMDELAKKYASLEK